MDIRVFGTPVCPRCKTVTSYLENQGVDHQYLTIGKDIDKEEMDTLIGRKAMSAPVIWKDGSEISFGALKAQLA